MGVVIEYQELVRQRRRRQERAVSARCVEILQESLAHAESLLHAAPPRERAVRVHRIEQLAELLEYVERRS